MSVGSAAVQLAGYGDTSADSSVLEPVNPAPHHKQAAPHRAPQQDGRGAALASPVESVLRSAEGVQRSVAVGSSSGDMDKPFGTTRAARLVSFDCVLPRLFVDGLKSVQVAVPEDPAASEGAARMQGGADAAAAPGLPLVQPDSSPVLVGGGQAASVQQLSGGGMPGGGRLPLETSTLPRHAPVRSVHACL